MLEGSIVALITPFLDNGDIDYCKLSELIEFQYQNKTKNLLILGTTSESSTLTEKEKIELLLFVIKKNQKRMKIVVGITSNSTLVALKDAKKYEAMGADYLLVITPYYNKCNTNGLIAHFKTIADNVNIPIILYNVPSRTNVNISCDTIKILKQHPNIIGLKEANNDITHIIEVSNFCDEKFHLYCGNDELLIIFILLGCKGSFNVYGNIDPCLMNLYFSEKNISKLKDIHKEYFKIFKLLFIEINPLPIKALMNYQGFKVGGHRLPLTKMNEDNLNRLVFEYSIIHNFSKTV